jgi:hypothetical protein
VDLSHALILAHDAPPRGRPGSTVEQSRDPCTTARPLLHWEHRDGDAVGARIDALQVVGDLLWGTLGVLAAATLATTCLTPAVQAARTSRAVPARVLRA